MKVEDGTGKGYSLKVGKDNRAQVRAVSEAESVHNGEGGRAYNMNTGLISITGDATLAYFKNTDTENFVVQAVAIGSFEGITHSDDPYITLIRNPTAGDLITDATTTGVLNQNRNFGSSKTADGLFYKGKVSGTVTGGDNIAILQVTPGGRSFYTIDFVIPKGSSIGIKLTANVSAGSANYYCALIGYFKDDEDAQ
jgi:hypothetical protein